MSVTSAVARMRFAVALLIWAVCGIASANPWSFSVSERDGLPVFAAGGRNAVTGAFIFWGKNWQWASHQTEFRVSAPYQYQFAGKNPLGVAVEGRVSRAGPQSFVWEMDFNASVAHQDVIGGGIAFKFDIAGFGAILGDPELLPDRRGWAWGKSGSSGRRIEMRFEPPPATLLFNPGGKTEARAMFYSGSIPAGVRRQKMTLTVTGDVELRPSLPERYGLDDTSQWPTGMVDWKTSPVDLSFLNAAERPAGKRGFARAVGDRLVFEDGTPARFWGTNFSAYTLFRAPREVAVEQARRLSQLGFNLVRIHHHDSSWVNPNVFGDRKTADGRRLDPAMLERIDWWVKCLKDEGIYVWLDIQVGRPLTESLGVDGFAEISKGKPEAGLRGFNYVNADIQRLMKQFAEAYLGRANAFTGVRYKDEPAVVGLMVTNENDLTHHFGNALLPDKNVPKHSAIYMRLAEEFAAKSGLPKDKTWRSWEHGPAKIFLNDLEQRFAVDAMSHLAGLGMRVPMVNTNFWGDNPLVSLPALTAGSMIDVHNYGGIGELEKNPLFGANLLHRIGMGQVVAKPLTVSEWNVEQFPAPDRHAIPLYMASTASHQGWDALMQYAYSQAPLDAPGGPSNWHAYNDPALIATLPAAALLYRQGHVREATTTYVFAPTRERLFFQPITADNAVALRTAMEQGKLMVAMPATRELPWLQPSKIPPGAKVITDPEQSQLPSSATEAVSDTGELRRNWDDGYHVIDTPRTQAAAGWIGGRKFRLGAVEITAATRNATVAVQSLDGRALGESRRILVSLGARSVLKPQNQMPYRSEPVEGQVTIRAPRGLKLYPRMPGGTPGKPIELPYRDGSYVLTLDKNLGTYWLVLGDHWSFPAAEGDAPKKARASKSG